MELRPGTVVDDRYVIEGLLGRGGMAVVYRARHRTLGTPVAVKVLTLTSASVQERLLREGRVQGRLRHPNVVAVTDVVQIRGQSALVMDFVEGPNLAQLIASRRPTLEQLDALAAGILAGAAAAHGAGLIHRDLKPGNILVDVGHGGLVPRIADFGLARALDEEDPRRTRSGASLGTPQYMAPEQVRSARDVDARADVWALGAVLYELATGVAPFEDPDTLELYQAIAAGRRAPVAELRPDLPARMVAAIDAALRVERADRPADAAALLELWAPATHVLVAPASAWDAATVELVRSLASSHPTSSVPPSDPHETWVEPAPSEPPVERPLPARFMAVAVAIAVLALLGVWLGGSRPGADGVAVEQTLALPTEAVPEGSKQLMGRAWSALQDARFDQAHDDASMVAAMYKDPWPELIVATAAWIQGRRGSSDEAFGKATFYGSPRALAVSGARDDSALLDAYLETEPGDALARTFRLLLPMEPADQGRHLEALHQAMPGRALPWWFEARFARESGDMAAAAAALDRAVAASPNNPYLSLEWALLARDRGDVSQAAEELDELLKDHPRMIEAWRARAEVDLALGREAERQQAVSALGRMAADVQIRFQSDHAEALLGQGRGVEARTLLDQAVASCERYRFHDERVRVLRQRWSLDQAVAAAPEVLEADRAAYHDALLAPELSAERRAHWRQLGDP